MWHFCRIAVTDSSAAECACALLYSAVILIYLQVTFILHFE